MGSNEWLERPDKDGRLAFQGAASVSELLIKYPNLAHDDPLSW